ncbi:MAG TPA: hypothetical protein DCY13_25100 [Verrucomicrobiales bacterium]|nr:hypothetical protein [Verrucomicrobiales bacterium]
MNRRLIKFCGFALVAWGLFSFQPGAGAESLNVPGTPDSSVRILSLSGTLIDGEGRPLTIGSAVRPGDSVRTANGEVARFVLGLGSSSSSVIRIAEGSEVEFVNFSPSTESEYPLLDTVISLRNDRLRSPSKRIF